MNDPTETLARLLSELERLCKTLSEKIEMRHDWMAEIEIKAKTPGPDQMPYFRQYYERRGEATGLIEAKVRLQALVTAVLDEDDMADEIDTRGNEHAPDCSHVPTVGCPACDLYLIDLGMSVIHSGKTR